MTLSMAMTSDTHQRHDLWKKSLISWTSLKLKICVLGKQCQQNEKTSHRLGENSWKRHNWLRTAVQNIQRTHKIQHKKTTQFKKWAKSLDRHVTREDAVYALPKRARHQRRQRWQICTWEDVPWSRSSLNCKLKQKWDDHYTTIKMVETQNTDNIKCKQGCGAMGTLPPRWQECKMVQLTWKNGGFLPN